MFRSVFLIDHILEGTKCFSTPTMQQRRDDPSSMNVGITRLNEILAAVSKWQQVVRATAIFSRWIRFAGCLAAHGHFYLSPVLQNPETINKRVSSFHFLRHALHLHFLHNFFFNFPGKLVRMYFKFALLRRNRAKFYQKFSGADFKCMGTSLLGKLKKKLCRKCKCYIKEIKAG